MNRVCQLVRTLESRPAPQVIEGVILRSFQGEADIDAWLTLRSAGFAGHGLDIRPWRRADFEREFLQKPWWCPERMLFATPQGLPESPLGTVTWGSREARRSTIHWLAVRPDQRRRGIGRLLLSAVEARVWDAGGRQVWLETHSAWVAAARFYARLGYSRADSPDGPTSAP